MSEQLLSVSKSLDYLGISRSTLYRMESKGIIKSLRLESGHRRFKLVDLEILRRKWEKNGEKEEC